MEMSYRSYEVEFMQEAEGGFTVVVPSLPGCITFGENQAEAEEMAKEAIDLYLEELESQAMAGI
jgi:antitoxin HicB